MNAGLPRQLLLVVVVVVVGVVVVVVAGSADCDVTVFRWEAGADGEDRRLWCAARMEQQRSQEH